MDVIVSDLSKKIGRSWVLKNICLTIKAGQVCGLVGPNGCGKTMLMRAITGLIRPTSGFVIIGDKQLLKDCSFPPSTGILLESPAFLGSRTGFEKLRILASIDNDGEDNDDGSFLIEKALSRVGLDPSDLR